MLSLRYINSVNTNVMKPQHAQRFHTSVKLLKKQVSKKYSSTLLLPSSTRIVDNELYIFGGKILFENLEKNGLHTYKTLKGDREKESIKNTS